MMNDPMAGVGAQPAAAGPEAAQGSLTSGRKEVFDPMAMQLNQQRIERVRSVMGIASGCLVGILGFTGLQGFGMNSGGNWKRSR